MKKTLLIIIMLFFSCTAYADIKEYKTILEEGNDGYATWAFTNQYGVTIAPDSGCLYVYDEASQVLQFSSCNSNPDDIEQWSFTPCATQILDATKASEAKLFTMIWFYPEGTPILTGQRTYRVWVNNSRSVKVTGTFPSVCVTVPQ